MNKIFIAMSMFLCSITSTTGFYDFKIETIDGNTIETSTLKGKKIVIAVVSASSESVRLINYLDSAQRTKDSFQVIAVPGEDFNSGISVKDFSTLKAKVGIIITKPLFVKNGDAASQDPLFNWLTNASANSHFNMDVSGNGQLFFISSKGTLYSVLPPGTPLNNIGTAINESFKE